MGQEVRRLLQQLGSTRAHRLPFGGYLAWVLTSWGPSWGEATAGHPSNDASKQDRDVIEDTWVDRNQNRTNITVYRNDWQGNRLESYLSEDKKSNLAENGGRKTKENGEKGRKRIPWSHNETIPVELWVEDKLSHYDYTSPVYLEVVIPLEERGKMLHYCDFLKILLRYTSECVQLCPSLH